MAKLLTQITESDESKVAHQSKQFSNDIIKSLRFPIEDSEGYVTGYFTGFELKEATGELKTTRKGNQFIDNRDQIEFTFTVKCEDDSYMDLRFWTGRGVDGIVENGKYSKFTTFLIAIGVLEKKKLHPRYKANEESIMSVLQEAFEGKFRFKCEMDGRLHKPILSTFEYLGHDESSDD